jgi:hypothetical protein
MRLLVVITVSDAQSLALARRPVAGQPWIRRLVERLAGARSVARVVVAAPNRHDELAGLLGSASADVFPSADPVAVARETSSSSGCTGIVFCAVEQFFADPDRLDAMADDAPPPDAMRVVAVLSGHPWLVLTGGGFVEIVTRKGLAALDAGLQLAELRPATVQTDPEPPEMRLEHPRDTQWAVAAAEALIEDDPSGRLGAFERVLARRRLGRFGFWDEVGPPPQSILTLQCMRPTLFEHFARHLARVPGTSLDVICPAHAASRVATLEGVRRVMPFDAPTFTLDALGATMLDDIRARQYDLCLLPRRIPEVRGFENTVPLALAASARMSAWIDVFGRCGVIAGRWQGWDPAAADASPLEHAAAWTARAAKALRHFNAIAGDRGSTRAHSA